MGGAIAGAVIGYIIAGFIVSPRGGRTNMKPRFGGIVGLLLTIIIIAACAGIGALISGGS